MHSCACRSFTRDVGFCFASFLFLVITLKAGKSQIGFGSSFVLCAGFGVYVHATRPRARSRCSWRLQSTRSPGAPRARRDTWSIMRGHWLPRFGAGTCWRCTSPSGVRPLDRALWDPAARVCVCTRMASVSGGNREMRLRAGTERNQRDSPATQIRNSPLSQPLSNFEGRSCVLLPPLGIARRWSASSHAEPEPMLRGSNLLVALISSHPRTQLARQHRQHWDRTSSHVLLPSVHTHVPPTCLFVWFVQILTPVTTCRWAVRC